MTQFMPSWSKQQWNPIIKFWRVTVKIQSVWIYVAYRKNSPALIYDLINQYFRAHLFPILLLFECNQNSCLTNSIDESYIETESLFVYAIFCMGNLFNFEFFIYQPWKTIQIEFVKRNWIDRYIVHIQCCNLLYCRILPKISISIFWWRYHKRVRLFLIRKRVHWKRPWMSR